MPFYWYSAFLYTVLLIRSIITWTAGISRSFSPNPFSNGYTWKSLESASNCLRFYHGTHYYTQITPKSDLTQPLTCDSLCYSNTLALTRRCGSGKEKQYWSHPFNMLICLVAISITDRLGTSKEIVFQVGTSFSASENPSNGKQIYKHQVHRSTGWYVPSKRTVRLSCLGRDPQKTLYTDFCVRYLWILNWASNCSPKL